MFADRNRTIADKPRLLVELTDYTTFTWLPESDGLDDELPALRFLRVLGNDFEQRLLAACGQPDISPAERDDLGAQGKVSTELARPPANPPASTLVGVTALAAPQFLVEIEAVAVTD